MSRQTTHDDLEGKWKIRGTAPLPKKKKRIGFLIMSALVFSIAVFIFVTNRGSRSAGTICVVGVALFLIGLTNKGKNRQFPNTYRDDDRWDNPSNDHPCGCAENEDDFAHHHHGDANDSGHDEGGHHDGSHGGDSG